MEQKMEPKKIVSELWKSDISEKEIEKLKNEIGEKFEKIQYKNTTYSDGVSTIDEMLQNIANQAEISIIEKKFMLERIENLCTRVEKLDKEIDNLDDELVKTGNENIKVALKKIIDDKKNTAKKIIDQILNNKFIDIETIEKN